ncbi:MAG TPA: hypothetical protein VKW08_12700, partial [Xanthobacteraceae bacterium]|nr:hypothetical protein [Xanthobacteraceae bacterium]
KSIACRHPAMAKLLVSSITDEESTKILPVPSGFAYQENPDSWNRSSSACSDRKDSLQSSPAGISPSKTGVRRPDDPRVHLFRKKMDCRVKPVKPVKPGNDAEVDQFDREPP